MMASEPEFSHSERSEESAQPESGILTEPSMVKQSLSCAVRALPFVLSLLRLPLAVLFFFLSYHRGLAILVLSLAALTDWLDGYLARRQGVTTFHGSILDPAMDKIFVLVALLALLHHGHLQLYHVFFVLSRDLFTVILTAVGYPTIRRRMEIRSRPLGKLVTNLQFATLLGTVVNFAVTPLAVITLVVSVFSIADYTWVYFRPRS
jgi:CDP-diacylglycerol--glycerol-3-phosphate 3-phosphatidyltransferase